MQEDLRLATVYTQAAYPFEIAPTMWNLAKAARVVILVKLRNKLTCLQSKTVVLPKRLTQRSML